MLNTLQCAALICVTQKVTLQVLEKKKDFKTQRLLLLFYFYSFRFENSKI